MEQSKIGKCFDELYHKTIPLILFSNVKDRNQYCNLLSSLFISYHQGNMTSFIEANNLLKEKLKNVSNYDRHQRGYIDAFINRYLSLEQRIENIEKTYLDFQGMVEQIKRDHETSNRQGKRIRELSFKINKIIKSHALVKLNNKPNEIVCNKTVEKKPDVCPICNTKLYKHKRKEITVYYCKENNRYKHWFRKDKNGKFFYCKICNSVMLGSGKFLRCSKCEYKEKVIE